MILFYGTGGVPGGGEIPMDPIPDDAFLELIERGFSARQIVQTLNSDINLVALKADILISQGHPLCPQEHRNDFLRYDK